MRSSVTGGLVLAIMASVAAVPALAQAPTDAPKPKDEDRVVCEKMEVLGTRLSAKRVCKKQSEWAEERRVQRQDIDRSQLQRNGPSGH